MKIFSICTAMAIFAAFSHAAPLEIEARNFRVWVTFQGAPPEVAYYTRSIPADGSVYYIGDVLSISHIVSSGGATCTFYGVDGSVTITKGAQTVDVGPPQTQLRAICKQY